MPLLVPVDEQSHHSPPAMIEPSWTMGSSRKGIIACDYLVIGTGANGMAFVARHDFLQRTFSRLKAARCTAMAWTLFPRIALHFHDRTCC